MSVAVITTASGRHDHLALQLAGLQAGWATPDQHVVVAMADPVIRDMCSARAAVIELDDRGAPLPVAAARNAGAERALADGAEVLIFLDVDCVPSRSLVSRYTSIARGARSPALFSGPVAYLPPPPPGGYVLETVLKQRSAHPARPFPVDGALAPLPHELFWSLSFAMTAQVWSSIGGFCEEYTGYGGEDTDFAMLARRERVPHVAVGGAWAFHQWHPAPDPPLQHLDDIVRNGRLFCDRWGGWPMQGWLEAFRDLGLLQYDPATDDWLLVADGC